MTTVNISQRLNLFFYVFYWLLLLIILLDLVQTRKYSFDIDEILYFHYLHQNRNVLQFMLSLKLGDETLVES